MPDDDLPASSPSENSLGENNTRIINATNIPLPLDSDRIDNEVALPTTATPNGVGNGIQSSSDFTSEMTLAKEAYDKGHVEECLKAILSIPIAFRTAETIRLMNRAFQKKEKKETLQFVANSLEAEAAGNIALAIEHLHKVPAHYLDLKILSGDKSITPNQILQRLTALPAKELTPVVLSTDDQNQTPPPNSDRLQSGIGSNSEQTPVVPTASRETTLHAATTAGEPNSFEATIERFFQGVSNWFHQLSVAKSFAIPLLALGSVFILLASIFSMIYSFNFIHQASALQAGLRVVPPPGMRTLENTNIQMINYLENEYSQYSVLTQYLCIAANMLTSVGAVFLLLRKRWAICILTSIIVTFTANLGWAPGILCLVLLLRKDVRECFSALN